MNKRDAKFNYRISHHICSLNKTAIISKLMRNFNAFLFLLYCSEMIAKLKYAKFQKFCIFKGISSPLNIKRTQTNTKYHNPVHSQFRRYAITQFQTVLKKYLRHKFIKNCWNFFLCSSVSKGKLIILILYRYIKN